MPGFSAQVEAAVANLPLDTAILKVTHESLDDSTRLALMVKGDKGWSFAAWLDHEPQTGNTETGVEVIKNWGAPVR